MTKLLIISPFSSFNSEFHFIESNKRSVSPGIGGNTKVLRTDPVPEEILTEQDLLIEEEYEG